MKTKEDLLASSQKHKLLIKKELTALSGKTTEVVKKLMIAGTVISSAYLLYKLFSDSEEVVVNEKEKSTKKTSSGLGRIGKVITQQAWLYILSESKQQIQEYLNKLDDNGNDS
ncbi:MAG: hypothetical protein OEW67_13070 [Cyclobacteriaceae bacterium]|nr:hypothetical protein [Cyclobacteriaceae bacterium]